MPRHISLQEDLFFNLKVLEHVNTMSIIDGCYYHYIKGTGESVTSSYYGNKYDMTNEVHDLLIQFYLDRCIDIAILKRINFIYIKNTTPLLLICFIRIVSYQQKRKRNLLKKIISLKSILL